MRKNSSTTIRVSIIEAKFTGSIGSIIVFAASLLFAIGLIMGIFRLRLIAGLTILFSTLLIFTGLIITYTGVSSISRKTGDYLIKRFYLNYIALRIVATVLFITALYVVSTIDIRRFLEEGTRDILKLLVLLPLSVISYVLMIISAVEFRNSYELLKNTSGNELFSITGFLYSIGSVLMIVIIGFIIVMLTPLIETLAWITLSDYVEKKT